MGRIARQAESIDITWANGASNSGSIDISAYAQGSVQLPAAMTNTAITVQVSNDGGTTWSDVRDVAGTAKGNITVGASIIAALHSEAFASQRLRFRGAAAELAQRTLTVFLKG